MDDIADIVPDPALSAFEVVVEPVKGCYVAIRSFKEQSGFCGGVGLGLIELVDDQTTRVRCHWKCFGKSNTATKGPPAGEILKCLYSVVCIYIEQVNLVETVTVEQDSRQGGVDFGHNICVHIVCLRDPGVDRLTISRVPN